ncbi:MAG: hypothetical protein PF795_12225, partial [Kiritimatiellae bacterium]|nr:hypothetical protein [Kiritimatiellia bacterium]
MKTEYFRFTFTTFFFKKMNISLRPSDSESLQTQHLQQAIDRCATEGGGIVTLQSGRFVSGSLQIRSNVHLFL